MYVMLSRKTLDLHTGVYMGAVVLKRDINCNGKVHVSDPNFCRRDETLNCASFCIIQSCVNLLNNVLSSRKAFLSIAMVRQ